MSISEAEIEFHREFAAAIERELAGEPATLESMSNAVLRIIPRAERARYIRDTHLLHPGLPIRAPAVHFVGFRGDEYHAARRVFGLPDFVHPVWDHRASTEIAPGDVAVFARYEDRDPSPIAWNDSERF